MQTCGSRTSVSSATANAPHSSIVRARSSGVACPASIRNLCSAACSIRRADAFSSVRPTAARAPSAISTTRTCWKPRSMRRAGASAWSTSRLASSSTTGCSVRPCSCGSSSRSTDRRASSCAASRCSAGRKRVPARCTGSHHISYDGYPSELRLTTDLPMSHLEGQPFTLTARHGLVLSWGAPVEEPLLPLCDRFLTETMQHWQRWVKHCDIPPRYQHEVIRSALALKLHCFEDTGAIIAAMTTSIPESAGSGRTWDYRYCWLRDAYYVVDAFRLLGQFDEREQFITYLLEHRRRQSGSLARADLRRRREVESGRTHRAELGRLERRRAGAHRQRRGVPRAARHLRRARPRARAGLSRRAVQRRAVAGDTRSAVSTGATRDRARRQAGSRASGSTDPRRGHARSRA